METWSFRMSNRISSMCFFPTSFGSTPWEGGEEREERRERRGEGGGRKGEEGGRRGEGGRRERGEESTAGKRTQ